MSVLQFEVYGVPCEVRDVKARNVPNLIPFTTQCFQLLSCFEEVW